MQDSQFNRINLNLCITGLIGIIFQCILFREIVVVAIGNEIIIGIELGMWLLFSGMGSSFFLQSQWKPHLISCTILIGITSSFLIVRFSSYLYPHGVALPFLLVLVLIGITQTPLAFLSGHAFATITRSSQQMRYAYICENIGFLSGGLLLWILFLCAVSNAHIFCILIGLGFLIPLISSPAYNKSTFLLFLCGFICIVLILCVDKQTLSVRYASTNVSVMYTHEGELAKIVSETDTTWLLNTILYKSTIDKESSEQSVHIPATQCNQLKHGLVILDKGYKEELIKYPLLSIDHIEYLKELSSHSTRIMAVEQFSKADTYDLIILGSSLPETVASNRFYTLSFFKHISTLLSKEGVFSFSIPFHQTYMPKHEKLLYYTLGTTLKTVFPFVLIFPTDRLTTFMASKHHLAVPETIGVHNYYLTDYLLPSVPKETIEKANTFPDSFSSINTISHPIALLYCLQQWIHTYKVSLILTMGILIIVGFSVWNILKTRSIDAYSIGSTGFLSATYGMALLILYQGNFGTLYSELSLLLFFFGLGLVFGGMIKIFPFSDSVICLYCVVSIIFLCSTNHPSKLLYLVFQFIIATMSSAQFVTRHTHKAHILNSADLFGGVLGMSLATPVLIPLIGTIKTILIAGSIKALVCYICYKTNKAKHLSV